MSAHQTFVDAVEAFLVKHGMSPTQFGVAALKDPRFVFMLRAGRSPAAKTMDRVHEFMTSHAAEAA